MRRSIRLLVATGLLFALPAAADAPGQFIDRSLVRFPEATAAARLLEAKTLPDSPDYGVVLRYAIADAPGLRLDVIVYPLGRVPTDGALEQGLADVEGGIRDQEKKGVYSDIRIEPATVFQLPGATVADAAPGGGAKPKASDDASEVLALFAQERAADRSGEGRRQAIALRNAGEPEQSLAYLFYRQLFLVKVRATAPAVTVPPASFVEVVDRVVAELVPAIEVVNVGTCANVEVGSAGPDADDATQRAHMLKQIVVGAERARRDGCVADAGRSPPLPAGFAQRELAFPAGTWDRK